MITPRPELLTTPAAAHGGRLALPNGTSIRHDFSVSLNAYGPAQIIREAVHAARIDEYPDPNARAACDAAATRWGRPSAEVMFAAGAAELIHLVCFAYVRPGDRVILATPAFGEYERATRLCSGSLLSVALDHDTNRDGGDTGDHIVAPLCDTVRRTRARLLFVCNPANPTGACLTTAQLTLLADTCATAGTLLVLDQAYDAFMERPAGTPALAGHDAVLHLRSITKDYALAGIRAAFAVGPEAVIQALERARIPWSASSVAQAAGIAAMSDDAQAHVARTTVALRTDAKQLSERIQRLGYQTRPSSTHFFLIRVSDASTFRDQLVQRDRILVRSCTSFGLPEWIRVAGRTPDENDALVAALEHSVDAARAAPPLNITF